MTKKAGRNDPCPCGSGKKYKRCCGSTTSENRLEAGTEIDYFKLNKDIAYKGRIGRQREEFCHEYIKQKQEAFKKIEAEQLSTVTAKGEKITCQKGCSFCCLLYVEATIQECEAIVYYLYHNETTFSSFLQKYPQWRERLRENGDLFKTCGQIWRETQDSGYSKEQHQAFKLECKRYGMQNIPCPFLHNDTCSIYEVRPYMCAGFVVTTPAEWCNPLHPNESKVYRAFTTEMLDHSFYYKSLERPALTFMPLVVYEILKSGFLYLSGIQGLESLESEAINAPEVRAVLQRWGLAPP